MKHDKYLKDKKRRELGRRIISILSAIVVFVATYALILPAITLDLSTARQEPGFAIDGTERIPVTRPAGAAAVAAERAASVVFAESAASSGSSGSAVSSKADGHVISAEASEETVVEEAMGAAEETDAGSPEEQEVTGAQEEAAEEAAVEETVQEEAESPQEDDSPEDTNIEEPADTEETDTDDAAAGSDADYKEAENENTDIDNSEKEEAENKDNDASGEAEAADTEEANSENNKDADSSGQENAADENAADTNSGNTEAGSVTENQETSENGATADAAAAESTVDAENAPEAAEVIFEHIITDKTGFYYYHADKEEDLEGLSSDSVTEWKKVEDDTVLAPADFVRTYIAYTIPEGTLTETNNIVRYRLPEGLTLTDKQIETINKYENGISKSARSDSDREKYLGVEAIEGTRTPDKQLEEGAEEYISATVKAEKVYKDNGDYLGQDLIFTFIPYTVQKNRNVYNENGNMTAKGQKVKGFFAFDLTPSQIRFEKTDDESGESEAAIIFVHKDKDADISEILRTLRLKTEAAQDGEDVSNQDTNQASEDIAEGDTDQNNTEDDKQEETKTLQYEGPDYAVTINYKEDSQIPDNAELSVREIEKGTDEYDSYLEQAQGAVDQDKAVSEARFFDITILVDDENGEGKVEFEPKAPVSVQITFAGIEKTNTEDTQLIHYTEDEVQVVDQAEFSKSEEPENGEVAEEKPVDTVQFETDGFSVYGIVGTELVTEVTLPGSDDTYEVTVTYGPEAKIPENVHLEVTAFATDSEEYADAKEAVIAAKLDEDDGFDEHSLGFAALDVSIVDDETGKKVEPAEGAEVKVSFKMKSLPEKINEDDLDETLEIQHLNEKSGSIVVETVAEAASVSVADGGAVAEFVIDNFSTFTVSWNNATNTSTNIRWRYNDNNTRGSVTVNYVNSDGVAITRPTGIDGNYDISVTNTDFSNEVVFSSSNVAQAITGRRYQSAYIVLAGIKTEITRVVASRETTGSWPRTTTTYWMRYYNGTNLVYENNGNGATNFDRPNVYLQYTKTDSDGPFATVHYVDGSGTELTVSNSNFRGNNLTLSPAYLIYDIEGYEYVKTTLGSVDGTSIRPVLQRSTGGRWQYTTTTGTGTPNWTNLNYDTESNRDIYVVYKEKATPDQGGTPKIEEDGGQPENPVILKESEPNEDGTNTLSLSVTGRTAPTRVQKLADVIVIFDISGSMNRDMEGNNIWGQDSNDTAADSDHDSRLYNAYIAVGNLADNLLSEERVNSNGEKLVRMSLVSFSNKADLVCNFTDNKEIFKNAVGGLKADGGTNWEAALRLANTSFQLAEDEDHVQDDELDPNRATFVVFVTDGAPTFRLTRYDVDDDDFGDDMDQAYYRAYGVYGQGNSDNDNRNYNAALAEAQSIVGTNKILYSVGISATEEQLNNLKTLTTASGAEVGEAEGSHSVVTSTESALIAAFDDIAEKITGFMGWGDIKMTDGITDLSSTVMEKSSLLGVDDDFTYWRAVPPSGWDDWDNDVKNAYVQGVSATNGSSITYPDGADEWTQEKRSAYETAYNLGKNAEFTEWNPADYSCNTASYVDGAVQWNMGDKFILLDGYSYKVKFSVWPSQEAYDWLANLKNGTKTWADVVAAGLDYPNGANPQIVKNGDGTYSLATNKPGAKTTYKSAVQTGGSVSVTGTDQELHFNEVAPMPLVPEKMTVKKGWDYDINDSHAAVSLDFRLKVGEKYYQKDGSFDTTTENAVVLDIVNTDRGSGDELIPAWTNSINIAPGIVIFNEDGQAKVLETGHKYELEEFNIVLNNEDSSQFDGSYEFTTQVVRPMVLTDVKNGGTYHEKLVYLVLVDDDNPLPSGAKTYTIDGEVYYVAVDDQGNEVNTLIGTNHRKAELDITKIINNNTDTDVSKDTFTYKVTLTVPDDADLSLITVWEYVQNTVSATNPPNTTLDGYQDEDHPITGDIDRFKGHIFRYATVSYGRRTDDSRIPVEQGFESIGNGKKQLVMYVSLLSNEVLRFTNLPTHTEYEIEEIYANYRQACTSRDVDAPKDAEGNDRDCNIAEQGYTVTSLKKAVGEEIGQEIPGNGRIITGTIDKPDTRYYNQFTNTLGENIEVELKARKHLDGYTWNNEQYYINLNTADGEGGNPLPGINGRTRFYRQFAVGSAGNADQNGYTFGKIRFLEPGTYHYYIAEDNSGQLIEGIRYDTSKTIEVVVTKDEETGKLSATVTGDDTTWNAGTNTSLTTITNSRILAKVKVLKIGDSQDNNPLSDVEFELYTTYVDADSPDNVKAKKADGTEYGTLTTLYDGTVVIPDLLPTTGGNKYYLVETKSHLGYKLLEDPVEITVYLTDSDPYYEATYYQKEFYNESTGAGRIQADEDGNCVITVDNNSGAELPMTGGPGTFLYTLSGMMLITLSALMYGFRMRRRERRLN